MQRALIDTDIWIDILNGHPPVVAERANAYWEVHRTFTISALTVTELVRGFVKRNNDRLLQQIRERISQIDVLPVDVAVADLAGEIEARLEMIGTPIGVFDPIIAATAICHDIVLVSANVRHYQRVVEAGYPLRLANWRDTSF